MLSVRDLVKSFPDGPGPAGRAVDGLSLDVEAGHVLTLLGPSGCGKTTTLRCIAGLERPDNGQIEVAGAGAVLLRGGYVACRPTGAASGWCSSPTGSGPT